MARYKIEFDGAGHVKRHIGSRGAKKLRKRVGLAIEEGIRDMAEESYQRAPKDTTALAQSIIASVQKEAPLTWYYGSTMPYAQRQEYEHKTKWGYFRRSIENNKPVIKGRLQHIIKNQFK